MEFPKQLKDQVYTLLQEPTLDKFREFLHRQGNIMLLISKGNGLKMRL